MSSFQQRRPVASVVAVALAAFAVAFSHVQAEPESILCPTTDQLLGRYESKITYEEIELYGDYGYISADAGDILIFDLDDPSLPVLVGTIANSENQSVLCIDGTRLYTREYGVAVSVYDIADPLNPVFIEAHTISTGLLLGSIRQNRAYLFDDNTRTLSVHDLSDGQGGEVLGSLYIEARARSMMIEGSLAYIMASGIMVVDVSNPSGMQILSYDTANRALDFVAISGQYLYCDYLDFSVLDISDPQNIERVGTPIQPVISRNAAVYGDRLFGLTGDAGLIEYDISDASRPRINGLYPQMPRVEDYGIDQNHIYCVGSEGLMVLDSTRPTSPYLDIQSDLEKALDSEKVGNEYWVAATEGVAVYAVVNESDLELLRIYDRFTDVHSVIVDKNLAYLFESTTGLRVLDVTDPQSPELIGQYTLLEPVSYLAMQGDRLVVQWSYDKHIVEILDVSSPTHPRRMSTISAWGDVEHSVVTGDYLYFTTQYGYLEVHDLRNPYYPQLVERLMDQDYNNIAAHGNHLYARVEEDLVVYQIAEAGELVEIARPELGSRYVMTEFEIQDDVLIFQGYGRVHDIRGIGAVDLSGGPQELGLIGELATVQSLWDIDAYGQIMLGMSLSGSVSLIDLSENCGSCAADLNRDGVLDFYDVSAFLTAYIAEDSIADFNSDAAYNFFDVSAFLLVYKGGCP